MLQGPIRWPIRCCACCTMDLGLGFGVCRSCAGLFWEVILAFLSVLNGLSGGVIFLRQVPNMMVGSLFVSALLGPPMLFLHFTMLSPENKQGSSSAPKLFRF